MAVTKLSNSTFTGLNKYDSFLAGNPGYLGPGAYESIATITLGSNTQTVTFSSIPSTYKHLQLRTLTQQQSNSTIRLNNDANNGSYNTHYVEAYNNGVSNGVINYTGIFVYGGLTAYTSTFGAGIIDILDYNSPNKFTTTRSITGQINPVNGILNYDSGVWLNTAAVTSVASSCVGSDFLAGSTFALYGIKG